MPGVTEEQITSAKQMSAIEFLRRYPPGQLVKAESRGEFQLKEHDSFKINETTSPVSYTHLDVYKRQPVSMVLIEPGGSRFQAVMVTTRWR